VSSATIAASHAGDVFVDSIAIPFGNRILIDVAAVSMTVAGINDSSEFAFVAAGDAKRRFHQYKRLMPTPRRRAKAARDSPLARHSANTTRASFSVQV